MSRSTKRFSGAWALAVLALVAVLAGCGGGNSSPTALKIGVSEQGKEASFSLPKSVEGGLVEVTLANEGKALHGLQFVRYTEGVLVGLLLIIAGSTSTRRYTRRRAWWRS